MAQPRCAARVQSSARIFSAPLNVLGKILLWQGMRVNSDSIHLPFRGKQ